MTTMRQLVWDRMHQASRGDIPGRYWYPLSVASYGEDEVLAAIEVLCSFRTTMGTETAAFEAAFAEWVGAEQAVMVNSGSSADLLVAFAERDGAHTYQGTVAIPAVTWPTHIWSWLMAGYTVNLIDVDPATLNVDPVYLDKVADEVDIVSVVHLMGNPCDMPAIDSICHAQGVDIFEDCCEALGAEVGFHGAASTWSFFFSHHMTTLEGGMVTTNDADLAEHYRLLRAHGWSRNLRNPRVVPKDLDSRYTFLDWGFNVRPTEVAAAFGMVQLKRLEEMDKARKANYHRFAERLDGVRGVRLPTMGRGNNPMAVPMMARNRDAICAHLEENGVETRRIVVGNIARHPASRRKGIIGGPLPGADEVHDHGFVVGLHPQVENDQIDKVAALITECAA